MGGDALGGESVSDSLPCCVRGAGDGCGLWREAWNEIERHIAGTGDLRKMLAAADYGPATHALTWLRCRHDPVSPSRCKNGFCERKTDRCSWPPEGAAGQVE